MKRVIILTDEDSEFLVSRADFKNYTTMDVERIRNWFLNQNYTAEVCKFRELDLRLNYKNVIFVYQTSELPGSFYKRYIEDIVWFLEKQGAFMLPSYPYLKAHEDKVFMELLRMNFTDSSLKTIKSTCYGSWMEAKNYNPEFPVVIKQSAGSGGEGVFLAGNKKEYERKIRKAGKILIASGLTGIFINYIKNFTKKVIKFIQPEKSRYFTYNTTPVSSPLVIQNFIPGLSGDYKVLVFGKKFYCMYRKNRDNDFRASGSGRFHGVPEEDHEGILNFARRLTLEIDFPILGMDIGFDGKDYHLIEFQMIHLGPSALQRSKFWHEYHDGAWVRYEGTSVIEDEFARSIDEHIRKQHLNI